MAYDKKADLKRHFELLQIQDKYRKRRFWHRHLPIVLTLAIAAIAWYSYQQNFHGEESIFIHTGVITLIVLLVLYPYYTSWFLHPDWYYQIKGSTDQNGNHRCINCGGRGIWRKGEYKSKDVYCRCSKCQFDLWKE